MKVKMTIGGNVKLGDVKLGIVLTYFRMMMMIEVKSCIFWLRLMMKMKSMIFNTGLIKSIFSRRLKMMRLITGVKLHVKLKVNLMTVHVKLMKVKVMMR